MKKYNKLVFIGRFQPFHLGHAKVIETALELAEKVIVLIGSSNRARSYYNPFTYDERKSVIRDWYLKDCGHLDDVRLTICPLNDHCNDTGWVTEVQEIANNHTLPTDNIGLIGHGKDNSSYYLGLFPQWGSVDVAAFTDRRLFNATDVRREYFRKHGDDSAYHWCELVEGIPLATFRFLEQFRITPEYDSVFQDHNYAETYKEDHSYRNPKIPYTPTHTAVDAVVVQSGHVLVIDRGARPGKGLMALPGGFLNPDERMVDAMLRELREETRLKVPTPVIKGNITKEALNDDPNRSARGRVISYSYLVELPPDPKGLPKVRGGDDAAKAYWVPLASLDPMKMFEDHYFIIERMVGTL